MTKPRTVIIGIDGVPFTLLKNYTEQDIMPNFKALTEDGVFTKMQSSIPEISSVSWSSMITGENPGKHNIFGFTDIIPNTYTMNFPNFATLKAEPFWLQQQNKKHVIINVPQTYPAKELNGFHVAGFVSLDLERAVYPQNELSTLQDMNYEIDVDANKAYKSMELFLTHLFKTHEKRMRLANRQWDAFDWDNFMLVFTGSDRIEHFLMDAYNNPDHPFADSFIKYFQMVDNAIGEINNKLSEDDKLLMLSDHGMEEIKTNVNLNNVLVDHDLLFLGDQYTKRYNNIQDESKAFVLDPGRVYLNKKNKYPKGTVTKEDEAGVIDDLIDLFSTLTFHGEKVVKSIKRREEIYHGPYVENAPDLVLLPNSGFSLRGGINEKPVFEHDDIIKGMHTQDDAFLYVKNKENAEYVFDDPTVEDVLGIMNAIEKRQEEALIS
ncbi:MAG: alkaline phosphatase family protein [Thermoplasmatota archaeon]